MINMYTDDIESLRERLYAEYTCKLTNKPLKNAMVLVPCCHRINQTGLSKLLNSSVNKKSCPIPSCNTFILGYYNDLNAQTLVPVLFSKNYGLTIQILKKQFLCPVNKKPLTEAIMLLPCTHRVNATGIKELFEKPKKPLCPKCLIPSQGYEEDRIIRLLALTIFSDEIWRGKFKNEADKKEKHADILNFEKDRKENDVISFKREADQIKKNANILVDTFTIYYPIFKLDSEFQLVFACWDKNSLIDSFSLICSPGSSLTISLAFKTKSSSKHFIIEHKLEVDVLKNDTSTLGIFQITNYNSIDKVYSLLKEAIPFEYKSLVEKIITAKIWEKVSSIALEADPKLFHPFKDSTS